MNREKGEIADTWHCPGCDILLSKTPKKDSGALKAERVWKTQLDRELKQTIRQAKQLPVLINYNVGNNRFEKRPDADDLELIRKIEATEISTPIPTCKIPLGDKTSDPYNLGITHIHHYYSRRSLLSSSIFYKKIDDVINHSVKSRLKYMWQSLALGYTKLNRYGATHYSQVNRILNGTLYIASLISEVSVKYAFDGKFTRLKNILSRFPSGTNSIVNTSSSTTLNISANSLDYIFVDPPFGSNLMYSELNLIWESWLGLLTNNLSEAVINKNQQKGLFEYQGIMQSCFMKFHQILKPGRWITIEFHNSQNSVWNSIQEALQKARFIIADVRVLDKEQGSFNQATASGAVKQDLIISAYKPNGNLEDNFRLKAGREEGVWEFVRYHLGKLPVVNQSNGAIIVNVERQAYLLFDRMMAFHIQRGVMIPISSPEFYAGLEQRFINRNGMFFLPDQVTEYDLALLNSGAPVQIPLFVTDEKTAIIWLRQQLDPSFGGEPQTRGELTNKFNQAMHRAKHEKALELIEILEQNFLQNQEGKWYIPDHNKASDLEKLRQRTLLREFKTYVDSNGRLRQFRSEAVRAGFADCLKRQEYDMIIAIAERLPETVLREDPDLLMYYDSAQLRRK